MSYDEYLQPSEEDINTALRIESEVEDMPFYLECLNNKPMSERHTPRELRDGCILTHHVYLSILTKK